MATNVFAQIFYGHNTDIMIALQVIYNLMGLDLGCSNGAALFNLFSFV